MAGIDEESLPEKINRRKLMERQTKRSYGYLLKSQFGSKVQRDTRGHLNHPELPSARLWSAVEIREQSLIACFTAGKLPAHVRPEQG
ncbi:MAG: hypothetical protein Q9216_003848 [Gyalolechia sp. 2 TL-2023]